MRLIVSGLVTSQFRAQHLCYCLLDKMQGLIVSICIVFSVANARDLSGSGLLPFGVGIGDIEVDLNAGSSPPQFKQNLSSTCQFFAEEEDILYVSVLNLGSYNQMGRVTVNEA